MKSINKTVAGQQHIYFYATKDIPTGTYTLPKLDISCSNSFIPPGVELLYPYGPSYNYSKMYPLDASGTHHSLPLLWALYLTQLQLQ
jgi:hypothetical protein